MQFNLRVCTYRNVMDWKSQSQEYVLYVSNRIKMKVNYWLVGYIKNAQDKQNLSTQKCLIVQKSVKE